MDPKTEELLRRPVYAYDVPPVILNSLSLKPGSLTEAQDTVWSSPSEEVAAAPSSPSTETQVGSKACSLCSLAFVTIEDQRGHIRSDLHNYNLKQKLRGNKPVSENDFEKLIADLDESLSGSDSSGSDEDSDADTKDSTLSALLKKQATLAEARRSNEDDDLDQGAAGRKGPGASPLLWFSSPLLPANNYFGLYKALFTKEELKGDDAAVAEALRKKQLEPLSIPKPAKDGTLPEVAYKGPHIFLCMIGGGHFAAMVVSLAPRKGTHTVPMNREATVLAHKTFHRYTTRRKQGGAQSASDSAKGAAHSVGSSLRRANETALVEEVRALLHDWKALLDSSDLLFVRASGTTNKRTLFGPYEGQVLRSSDPRMRTFPFNTKRATQKELMRSFIELTRLKVREVVPAEAKPQAAPAPTKAPAPKQPAKPALSEEEETALLHTSQIQAMIRRSRLPALLTYLKTNELGADFRFYPPEQNHHAPSPLHLAASQNAAVLVAGLLGKAGADPGVRNREGKTAFELAGDRSTRDAFRVARSEVGEKKWDWDSAGVPGPLTKAEADERERRERKESESRESERRRAEEERLEREGPRVGGGGRRRQGVMAAAGAMKSAEEKREEEGRGLSAEMRARLERERRARAAEERIRRMQQGS
ncbi:related to Found in Mitochondrial Proteome [Cephalotrichum gorgonifer]|uniref:Related to Found in Mitochondrial Proteome n=1 Tax=Cephalotrichum gorgonifer TaxID=2041049 RepID=A0AAE8SST4_9PEZI|nr:related to Found in Mitochondrial Proteome [Cephalotrichum gorgonifer]